MFNTNEYFDGNVISIAYKTEKNPASVGVMAPGNYVFNTSSKEKMTVISGALEITLANENNSTTYNSGESFNIDANSSFDVKVKSDTAYLCIYG